MAVIALSLKIQYRGEKSFRLAHEHIKERPSIKTARENEFVTLYLAYRLTGGSSEDRSCMHRSIFAAPRLSLLHFRTRVSGNACSAN